ncbi:MAG: hypothetical protein HN580_02240 [Deltaproteobacteria bacterium]|jgi:uroporphyrinogen-III decarboxylase|nr:hypothetical protein [Deltaproteobacteria bacterium]MBT4267421.1 hypothetical protein [Deltaproteobacteria bacterium]MBT4640881.1 hypothetical protein [Deltaproteobacteria bacterium]MBT6503174.1 hypothetical protein [Deltaproteobacteria bacterium]MBT6612369.1 hypothetical protein [Deltaproteobacteria bacterium]
MAMETKTNLKTDNQKSHVIMGVQSNDHSAYLAGIPTERFFTDALTFAQVQLLVTEYYQLETVSNFWDVYNIEAEALGQKVIYVPGGLPDIDRKINLIETPADLDKICPPDPYKSGRMPWVLDVSKHLLEMTGKLDRVYFTAPFSLAVNIRGYENLVYDMQLRPEFAHRLFKFICDDVLVPFLETIRNETGLPDLILDGRDAWGSPPLISLDMMDEYVVAYTKRLRDKLGQNLITRGNWGDAKSRDPERFFAQKLQCCPGALSVLDPDLFEVGPKRAKRYAIKHNTNITAGVDAALLKQGPVEAIVDRIKLYIDTMARDERCLIHLNQIPAETPPEHVHAAVAACKAYGQFPIPKNLDGIHLEIPEREHFLEFMQKKKL